MRIGEHDLERRSLVIAEIGNNHEGDPAVAERLVREAAACGVDAVKFQTLRAAELVGPSDAGRFAQLESFELTEDDFTRLAGLARSLGVLFLSTPFGLRSAEFLHGLVPAYKIASGDLDFLPLIERVVGFGKPLILSTGGSDLELVRATVRFVKEKAATLGVPGEVALLHCVSSYPAPPEEVNLRAIPVLARELGCPVGYSDHALGIEAAVSAVAAGAVIVEKHFTLDHHFSDFRDHQLSADPGQMTQLVERIRALEVLLGEGRKAVQPSERATLAPMRRSIVAARKLPAGHRLEATDLTWLRPAGGLSPGSERVLLGRALRRAVAPGERLGPEDVE